MVQRQVKAKEHADRARRDLPAHGQPVARGLLEPFQVIPPALARLVRHVEQGERNRPSGLFSHLAQNREFHFRRFRGSRDDLEHASVGIVEASRERAKLVDIRIEAGRQIARLGPVHNIA